MKSRTAKYVRIPVIKGNVLGVSVLRGFAPLCDLARVSQADIYDPKTNPTGTQRDLSPKHAKDAYDYIRTAELGFWPEVFLSARNGEVLDFQPVSEDGIYGIVTINIVKIASNREISISRVDGNHRLHYADGATEGYPAIEKPSSFCLAVDLSLDQEIALFRDINNNQRRMSTSHLDNVEVRLTPEEQIKKSNPELHISKKLGDDPDSPFYGRIYDGGKKTAASLVPLRTLKTGIEYMMSRPTKLTALPDADVKYKVIRNYFSAVKRWSPESWKEPKKHLLLRGAGLWGICFLGAEVIDRALSNGQYSVDSMLKILKSGKNWDWSNDGNFQGLSGRGGATKIRDWIVSEFQDESGASLQDLYKKIMEES
ncbi:DGQHR domain-containing protein [Stutzerimonas stutzeri]